MRFILKHYSLEPHLAPKLFTGWKVPSHHCINFSNSLWQRLTAVGWEKFAWLGWQWPIVAPAPRCSGRSVATDSNPRTRHCLIRLSWTSLTLPRKTSHFALYSLKRRFAHLDAAVETKKGIQRPLMIAGRTSSEHPLDHSVLISDAFDTICRLQNLCGALRWSMVEENYGCIAYSGAILLGAEGLAHGIIWNLFLHLMLSIGVCI